VGTRIPGAHKAARVELKDCVVNDRIHQSLEALFAFDEAPTGGIRFGHLACLPIARNDMKRLTRRKSCIGK
jgi:hypothetical protein